MAAALGPSQIGRQEKMVDGHPLAPPTVGHVAGSGDHVYLYTTTWKGERLKPELFTEAAVAITAL